MTVRRASGFAERLAGLAKRRGWAWLRTWRRRFLRMGRGSAAISKPGWSPGCWAESLVRPVRLLLLMRARARPNKQVLGFEGRASPFVAVLPQVEAAKLTISASYW